jgi:hypothetical protein
MFALVGYLDRIVGARERSSFIAKAVRAIDDHERSAALKAALGFMCGRIEGCLNEETSPEFGHVEWHGPPIEVYV